MRWSRSQSISPLSCLLILIGLAVVTYPSPLWRDDLFDIQSLVHNTVPTHGAALLMLCYNTTGGTFGARSLQQSRRVRYTQARGTVLS